VCGLPTDSDNAHPNRSNRLSGAGASAHPNGLPGAGDDFESTGSTTASDTILDVGNDTENRISSSAGEQENYVSFDIFNKRFQPTALKDAATKYPWRPCPDDENNIFHWYTCNAKQPTNFWIDTIAEYIGMHDMIATLQICDALIRITVSEGGGFLQLLLFYSLFITSANLRPHRDFEDELRSARECYGTYVRL